MVTVEQAKSARHGDIFHMKDEKNADGTPVRWRVTGKVKTWKTRPNDFRIPVKHGLYDYGAVTHLNLHLFSEIV